VPSQVNESPPTWGVRQLAARFPRISLSELAAGLVAVATIAVMLGAFLYWMRFERAGLPALESLAVVPRELYILTGIRELVLPAVCLPLSR